MTKKMEINKEHRSPGRILDELGITSPDEIDIEAIAFHCGAMIRYRPLTGCDARIVGNMNNAIITVNSDSPRARQRFSAAHELGHWAHDRGRASFSCKEEQFVQEWSRHNPESRANRYASDLLLPTSLFLPKASTFKRMDFDVVSNLAKYFNTSLTATTIRLVECGPFLTMLVCYSAANREWFVRNPNVPEQLWPPQKPGLKTYAFALLKAGKQRDCRGEVPAEAWFEHRCAENYYIYEHSFRTSYGDVLTLLWWGSEEMIIDVENYEERKANRRSDNRLEE